MSDQPPLPGRPSAWNQDDEQTLPYGVPSRQPQPEPQQPPYGGQPSPPHHGQPQQPQHYGQPQHHGQTQPPQAPYPQQPYPQAQYPPQPHQVPPHQQQPQYTQAMYQQQPHPQAPYPQPPYDGQQPAYYQAPPRTRSKAPWLVAGAIAVVVALVSAAVVVISRTGGESTADAPVPTGSYTDGLATPESSPSPTDVPSSTPTEPVLTPTPSPTPTERRRTLKDVDEGIKVYDDVYVKPAIGWRKYRQTKYAVVLSSPPSQAGAVVVGVDPVGYAATTAASKAAQAMIDADHLTGVRKQSVKTLRPANSNIDSQAELSYSGRFRQNGLTVSLAGRCVAMTGVESIHNVTVVVCVEARKDNPAAAFRDANRMLASVARSI